MKRSKGSGTFVQSTVQKCLTPHPTEFQLRVYEVVKGIPKGQVRSYRWVASKLGNPNAARAVGQALGCNPWPETVPCHRVVRSDGSLGGYAWGLAKKRRLLASEGAEFQV